MSVCVIVRQVQGRLVTAIRSDWSGSVWRWLPLSLHAREPCGKARANWDYCSDASRLGPRGVDMNHSNGLRIAHSLGREHLLLRFWC
jgi:hypothetical protein